MIKVIDRTKDDVAIIIIEGKLSGFEGKGKIQDKIRDLIDNKINKIVIDLSKVSWIDSTGLGELIASLSSVKKDGGNLVLSNIQSPVQSLLKMTNLAQIFDTYESVDQAITEISA